MKKSYTLGELAEKLGAQLIGSTDVEISGVGSLEEASSKDASFLANPRYKSLVKDCRAGVICIELNTDLIEGKNYLLSSDPSRTFQGIVELLFSHAASAFQGVHPTAVIDPSVELGPDVTVGPYAVIDRGVKVGARTKIGPHVTIGYHTQIGNDCLFHAGSTVRERCEIGSRVILQPGAVIGSCGFGFTMTGQGTFERLEQLGIVILEDDVEIGANTTVDRSRFQATRIGKGTKIDNLCQIAHNVEVGENNAIAAQTGIAGSTKTGKRCMLGGQVGVLGHVELADDVIVVTRGGVSKSLKKKGTYRGSPAMFITEYHRQEAHIRKLAQYVERLKELERQLALLQEKNS